MGLRVVSPGTGGDGWVRQVQGGGRKEGSGGSYRKAERCDNAAKK